MWFFSAFHVLLNKVTYDVALSHGAMFEGPQMTANGPSPEGQAQTIEGCLSGNQNQKSGSRPVLFSDIQLEIPSFL